METTLGYEYSVESYTSFVEPCEFDDSVGANLSFLFYFMFLFSLCGNGLVLVIIHRFEKLTTVINILLLNLVFSSIIFMSSLPFLGIYMQLSNWIFGQLMCKIVGSVYYLGFFSSVLFLTLLTFDRHLAVVYSLGSPRVRNKTYAVISCMVVWLISGLACVPQMVVHNTFYHPLDEKTYCDEYPGAINSTAITKLREAGYYIQLFLFLLFPLAVIIYCYVRIAITVMTSKLVSKFKTVRLIFIIVVLFFVCWTPFNIALLMHGKAQTCEETRNWNYAIQVTRNLAYLYFCISPIFYTFVGRKFQNYFRQMMVKRFPGLKKHISVTNSASTKVTPNEL